MADLAPAHPHPACSASSPCCARASTGLVVVSPDRHGGEPDRVERRPHPHRRARHRRARGHRPRPRWRALPCPWSADIEDPRHDPAPSCAASRRPRWRSSRSSRCARAGALRRPLPVGQPGPVRALRPGAGGARGARRGRRRWTASTSSYGEQVADAAARLDGTFDWHEVDAAEAASGLKAARYDFTVTLPADFSADLPRPRTRRPDARRSIELTTNDTNSYLATTIGEPGGRDPARPASRSRSTEQAAAQPARRHRRHPGRLADAADGAAQLARRHRDRASGAAALADGTVAARRRRRARSAAAPRNSRRQADQLRCARRSGSTTASPQARADIAAAARRAGARRRPQIDAVLAQARPGGVRRSTTPTRKLQTHSRRRSISSPPARSRWPSGAAIRASGAAQLRDGLGTLAAGRDQLRDGLDDGLAQIPRPERRATRARQSAARSPTRSALETVELASAGRLRRRPRAVLPAPRRLDRHLRAVPHREAGVAAGADGACSDRCAITLAGWLTPGILGVAADGRAVRRDHARARIPGGGADRARSASWRSRR